MAVWPFRQPQRAAVTLHALGRAGLVRRSLHLAQDGRGAQAPGRGDAWTSATFVSSKRVELVPCTRWIATCWRASVSVAQEGLLRLPGQRLLRATPLVTAPTLEAGTPDLCRQRR